jgi:serine protease
VAGTIAQATHNKFGVAGVAPQAAIMPIKVLSKQGYGTTADIADGIRWAVKHGAHVINMSLGGGSYSEALAKAVKYAHDKGVVVVCAAGNTGRGTVQYPAAYPGALAVSALGPDGKKAWYSSFGKEIFIGGPGGDTRVDLNRDGIADGVLQDTIAPGDPTRHGFFPFQGTSMASPHVAGAAALLVARGVTNPDKVAEILAKTAQPRAEKDQYGAGVLDVAGAVQALESDQWVGGGLTMALLALVVLARRGRFQGEPARVGVGGTVLALWAGAGLFPLAWWLGDALPVSLLAAPLPEWERVVMGPSWGPTPVLASAAVPVLASLFLLGIWKVRGLLVGLSVGVAAWLLTAAWAGAVDVRFIPGRGLLDAGWLVVNAVACLGLARLMMRK